jgi:hypothetical protein
MAQVVVAADQVWAVGFMERVMSWQQTQHFTVTKLLAGPVQRDWQGRAGGQCPVRAE